MTKKELQQPIPEELMDEQLDAVTGGFSNEEHTFIMEPGVIMPGTTTVEPGKIIPGEVVIGPGAIPPVVIPIDPSTGIEPYVMEPNITLAPSEAKTR